MNKIFKNTPISIVHSILDFIDEDKYYNKPAHKRKLEDVLDDMKYLHHLSKGSFHYNWICFHPEQNSVQSIFFYIKHLKQNCMYI
tara:strand:+ start:479 stop:733 length:255 start_codon:yes stop_codon:yes gene_type:complete